MIYAIKLAWLAFRFALRNRHTAIRLHAPNGAFYSYVPAMEDKGAVVVKFRANK